MRTHPIAAASAAVLLCAFLASCSRQEEDPQDTAEPPVGAAAEPETEEADEASPSPEDPPAGDDAIGAPVGWAGQSLETDDGEAARVTGGAGGETVTATDSDDLADRLAEEEPLTVEVSGEIDLDGVMEVGSDKTLVGVEGGAELTGGRLVVDGAHNVVLANLRLDEDGTAVAVRGGAHHVWVHGSTFVGDDGPLVAVTDGADHVTLSWNHFRDAEAAITVGSAEDEPGALRVTVHHNFFDGTAGRHPDVRRAEHVHVFNNYFRANAEYGVRSGYGSDVLVEGNYFEDTALSVSMGEEEPGNVVTRDNLLVDSEQPDLRGDVSDPPYAYELDDTVTVPDMVTSGAGVR